MISLYVDSIPSQVLLEETSYTGRPAFHPAMLMKMTLLAYARQVFSGRKIVQMSFPWNGWAKIPVLAIKRLITSAPVNMPTT